MNNNAGEYPINLSPHVRDSDFVDFVFPPNLVAFLKRAYLKGEKEQAEYAGNIRIEPVEEGKGLKYMPSKAHTSGTLNTVEAPPELFTHFISWHTHPHPLNDQYRSYQRDARVTPYKNSFTLPSDLDFNIYIENWPTMQVHFIADKYGYYLVDYIQSPNLNPAYMADLKRRIARGNVEFAKYMQANPEFFTTFYNGDETGICYYHCRQFGSDASLQKWKKFINDAYADLFQNDAIRCTYYTYSDTKPLITINNVELNRRIRVHRQLPPLLLPEESMSPVAPNRSRGGFPFLKYTKTLNNLIEEQSRPSLNNLINKSKRNYNASLLRRR